MHRRLHDLIKRGEIRANDSGEWDLEEIASTERMGERSGPVPAHGPGDSSTPFAAMLDEPSRRLLLAAFVLGDTADPELIEELASQRDERDLVAHDQRFARSAMRDLLVAGLITHGPEGLSAAPSRELKRIIAETPPDEIRKLHGRAASILLDRARSSATPSRWSARIARHLEEAGKLDRAAKMWLEAGSVALASSRNHVALARFERALALATSPELRFESALALGDLRARSGDATGALSAYEEAEASSRSPELEDELDDRIGRVLQKLRRVDEADVRFRRTLARAGNDPLRRGRALLRLAGIAFDQHEPVEARRLYGEALPLVQLAGAVDLELAVHSGVGILDKQEGDLEHAAARFERALECAERLSRPLDTAAVLNNLGTIWRMRGRADEALRCLERSIDLRERAGDRRGLAICFTNLARIHRARGELAQAEDSTARALSIFIEVGDGKGVLIARHNIAEIAIARSRFDVALEQIRRLEEDAHGEHAGPILASAGVLRAKVESQRAGPA
ncbi:MAG TPA: tetratricopeptide repeat protein, partial [Planctomycetota bacterium]|nr:tetratricopeptide repeat protein [Planctomycetota bacterium]